MSLNADGFQGLELVRHQGIFEFAGLSGGTKEQLAAAVPLAIAELLAATRGLRIVILSGTPSDYDTLGATEIVRHPQCLRPGPAIITPQAIALMKCLAEQTGGTFTKDRQNQGASIIWFNGQ